MTRTQDLETQHWSVSVDRNGVNLVAIESNSLSGQPEYSEEDRRVIRECAAHLLAFIGAAPSVDRCRIGESMAGDYVEHAAHCPECQAHEDAKRPAAPPVAGPCQTCGHVPGVLSETLTAESQQDDQAAAPAAGEAAPFDAEMFLRREWWLGHGHSVPSLYGDDGEMQCHECRVWDYRRAPLADLDDQVRTTRLHRAAAALAQASKPVGEAAPPCPVGEPCAHPLVIVMGEHRRCAICRAAVTEEAPDAR